MGWISLLTKTGVASRVIDAIVKHGLVVTLLVCMLVYTEMQRHRTSVMVQQQIQSTREEVMACQNEMIRLYREDRQQTLDVLRSNVEILKQVEIALER